MGRSWWAKAALLLVLTALSAVYVYPTVANLDLEKTKFPFKQKINLGLDLQGGLYLVLGVDFQKVFHDVVARQEISLNETFKDKNVGFKGAHFVKESSKEDPRVAFEFDPAKRDEVYSVIKKQYWNLRLSDEKPGHFELGLSNEYRGEVRDHTMSQSIEVIRNRIDEFGVSEPSITSQGTDRIVVELPGIREIERAKDLIGRTAKLEFKIVEDKKMSPQALAQLIGTIEKEKNITYKEGQKFSEYVRQINEAAVGKIPEGTEIAFERIGGKAGKQAAANENGEANVARIPYLLTSRADVTGDDLQDAQVQLDQETRRPNVGFTLNPRGAVSFDKLTGDNIGKRLAIVLDNIVHSAPVIQSRIGARGQITLGSGDGETVMREAKDLAIVLRAGALPAQLDFLEQRVMGPTLGADSIHKGALAAVVGSLAVFLFVLFYYRVSGVFAVVSLVLNVLYVLAIQVGLETTLTLPGIAGIALTVGIAVDSNVVIYERIREELRHGKQVGVAIEAGFQKAFRTILDANVTNAAAAIVLMMYGTGPIKGFAVTLLIGIVTTLFTAVFVCKVLFDWYLKSLEDRGAKTLSI